MILALSRAHHGAQNAVVHELDDGSTLFWELLDVEPDDALLAAPVAVAPGWLMRHDRIDFPPGGIAYRHTHPGPVFISVIEGTLTFYEHGDPTCAPKVVSKGQGYVDTGRGHVARNESGAAAKDVTVIVAPVGRPFRGELPAPAPGCKF